MKVADAIQGRRAVRDFTLRPVSETLITRLIQLAVQAPNAMNRQPWTFIAITDKAALVWIARDAKSHRLASIDQTPQLAHLRDALSNPGFDILYDAPALVVICATAEDEMAVYDCCLAAQNLMLSAHAEGLGSCWVGLAESWLASAEGRSVLGLPDGVRPIAPIILGHPQTWPTAPGRRAATIQWIRGPAA